MTNQRRGRPVPELGALRETETRNDLKSALKVQQGGRGSVPVKGTGTEPPRVRGWVYAPHAGRKGYLILVRRCVYCGAAHRHTSEVLANLYKRGCRVTGKRYFVRAMVERDTGRVVLDAA